jgi:hypothetical protein
VNLFDERTLSQLPGQCVFSSAVSNEKDAKLVCHVQRVGGGYVWGGAATKWLEESGEVMLLLLKVFTNKSRLDFF